MTMEDFVLNPYILTVPPYTPGKTLEELQEEYGLETIVDLGSNQNPLGPSPLAIEAIKQTATDMHCYSTINVAADQLRCKLAESIGPNFDKDNVIIKIIDTGIGLKKAERERVFQPYYRKERDRDHLSGLGLGLAICKNIIDLHNGRIWVESRPRAGSTFCFSIPFRGELEPVTIDSPNE